MSEHRLPAEPSQKAIQRSFEDWYGGKYGETWEEQERTTKDDWRDTIRVAYAIDSGRGDSRLVVIREVVEALRQWAEDCPPTHSPAAAFAAIDFIEQRFLNREDPE